MLYFSSFKKSGSNRAGPKKPARRPSARRCPARARGPTWLSTPALDPKLWENLPINFSKGAVFLGGVSDAAPQSVPFLDDFTLHHGHCKRIKRASNLKVERSSSSLERDTIRHIFRLFAIINRLLMLESFFNREQIIISEDFESVEQFGAHFWEHLFDTVHGTVLHWRSLFF